MSNSEGSQRLVKKKNKETKKKTSYCQCRLFDHFYFVSQSCRHFVSGDP